MKTNNRTKDLLTVRDMAEIINEGRAAINKPPVGREWIRVLCREWRNRKLRGQPYIPAERMGVHGQFFCQREDFEQVKDDIVNAHDRGRPNKVARRAKEGIKHTALAGMRQLRETNQQPADLHELSNGILGHVTGYRVCGYCKGDGCEHCIKGWVPRFHPAYPDGHVVFDGDIVRVPFVEQTPAAIYGKVMGFDQDSRVMVDLLDDDMRPLDSLRAIPVEELELLNRAQH